MNDQNLKHKIWNLSYRPGNEETDLAIARLQRESGVSGVMARLLYTRGYPTAERVRAFLKQEETSFHDPFLLLDMEKAVERVTRAIDRGERIAIYGDYDVDGVTSVSLLYLYLKERGADVSYYIPSRMKEGYGLSAPAIDTLHARGVRLMITVDTGITATEETLYASSLGIDTVVTDHHECRPELPSACAVVNPHRVNDPYPFKELAGVGVVFKLITALEITLRQANGGSARDAVRFVCDTYADLVAIGTIADVMPIVDENRLIVTLGLRMLQQTKRLGLRALIDAASGGTKKRKINSTFIGFVIAPRMNAAGRVSSATIAVELLLEEDPARAVQIADKLCELNATRQREENRIAEQAYDQIEKTLDKEKDHVIVIANDSWQQGIIGIVSSRITERYGMPSILISYEGAVEGEPIMTDQGKGSGRSVKGLNLVEALLACEDLLVRFGGHELAAGLTVRRGNVDAFRKRINEYAAQKLGSEPLRVMLEADCEVQTNEITMKLAEEITALEPFGVCNAVPQFVWKNATLVRVIPMGAGKHVKLILEKDGVQMSAVWFGMSPLRLPFEVTEQVDVMFQLNLNEYQNTVSLQLLVQDMRLSDSFEAAYAEQKRLYRHICEDGEYTAEDRVLPTRDDMAVIYQFLRREYRNGHSVFTARRLLAAMRSLHAQEINYVKLKFTIRIMQELLLCGVTETEPDTFVFEFYDSTAKTNIEKSSILHKLKRQMRKS